MSETQLTTTEAADLQRCEQIIERGLQTFVEVGEALMDIRDKRLYRATHKTFEEYCKQRWQFDRTYAHRLMRASQVVENLLPMGNILPENERQVRPLSGLTPEQQKQAWGQAIERADGGQPTAAQVAAAAAKHKPTPIRYVADEQAVPDESEPAIQLDEPEAAAKPETTRRLTINMLVPGQWYPCRLTERTVWDSPFATQAEGAADARYTDGFMFLPVTAIIEKAAFRPWQIVDALPAPADQPDQPIPLVAPAPDQPAQKVEVVVPAWAGLRASLQALPASEGLSALSDLLDMQRRAAALPTCPDDPAWLTRLRAVKGLELVPREAQTVIAEIKALVAFVEGKAVESGAPSVSRAPAIMPPPTMTPATPYTDTPLSGWESNGVAQIRAGAAESERRNGAAVAEAPNRAYKNSSASDEWYTPDHILTCAHCAIGKIDLDPASSSIANERVRAEIYYTIEDDGLTQDWYGKVWLNPPYGDAVGPFVDKLLAEFRAGRCTEALLLVAARTDTQWFRKLREFPRCFLWGRLRFTNGATGEEGDPAGFPSMVVYLGPNDADFVTAFNSVGDVYTLWGGQGNG